MTREEQDAFSARSHQNAAKAWKDGYFDDEVVTVQIPQRKGDPIEFRTDEGGHPRGHHDRIAGQPAPGLRQDGTITAGSASQISDGACAVVVMKKSKAQELGLDWLAEIGAHGVVAGPDSTLQSQPAEAIRAACAREASRPPTSTWSRSTRPSLRSASSRRANWACRDKVTPTVAPSPWGTSLGMSGASP